MKEFEKSGCNMLTYEMLDSDVQHFDYPNWEVTTAPIAHNVDNHLIILKSKHDNEKLCYMTDFFAAPMVENCENFLYEVNYIEAKIDDMIEQDKEFKHTNFKYHNSLEKAKEYFSSLKTIPKSITICHLSHDNANAKQILKEMKPFADEVKIARRENNAERK